MRFFSTSCSRVLLFPPLMAVAAVVPGCEEGSRGFDYRDQTDPIAAQSFRPSFEAELEAFTTLPDTTDGEFEVRLVVKNPAADTLQYEYGPCFFVVRAYASEDPVTRPVWDHRGVQTIPRICDLELGVGAVGPHGVDTLNLIPEGYPAYDRAFPENPASFWVILNLDGNPHWLPAVIVAAGTRAPS